MSWDRVQARVWVDDEDDERKINWGVYVRSGKRGSLFMHGGVASSIKQAKKLAKGWAQEERKTRQEAKTREPMEWTEDFPL